MDAEEQKIKGNNINKRSPQKWEVQEQKAKTNNHTKIYCKGFLVAQAKRKTSKEHHFIRASTNLKQKAIKNSFLK